MVDTKTNITPPTEDDVTQILHEALGKKAVSITRFPTDVANYVYDVKTEDGDTLAIRLARPDVKHFFDGALFWYRQLEEKGIPLPKLYYSDANGQHGFPIMIMDRLPGEDLGIVYPQLSSEQKRALAHRVYEIQKAISTLPKGKGYGYARFYNDPSLYPNWIDVLNATLERSRERIREAGLIDENVVDKVRAVILEHNYYFSTVEPVCFLANTTTKNVVVNDGRLSGIVGMDCVAFGDSLLTIALTQMSLLYHNFDTDYTNYWLQELNLNFEQRKAFDSYTLVNCVERMGLIGKDQPETANEVQHLKSLFEKLIHA